ncbi:MAG: M20/M25/M40 family metallo-hydrolase, partial [Armatimonadota bacterium]|nr:M20/M25/M40 family metallo-hydrolase [Armatimonadota bacterium]
RIRRWRADLHVHTALSPCAADDMTPWRVVAAAQVVTALQHVVSRQVSPLAPAVITVTAVQAGDAYNVIPEEARLKGTLRVLDASLRRELPERMRRVAHGVCDALGVNVEAAFHEGCPVMANDPRVCVAVREAAALVAGVREARTDGDPSMAAEDFALYLREVPGALIRLGLGDTPPLHNPRFDFPDAAVPVGIELLSRAALRLMAGLPPG